MGSNPIDPRLQPYGSLPPVPYGHPPPGGHPTQLPPLHGGDLNQRPQPYYRLPPTGPPAGHPAHSSYAPIEHTRHHSQHYQTAPHEQYYPAEYGSPHSHDGDDPNDPKRARACEACRGLKVRCDRDPNRPDVPCKRCAKAKRECIITAPTRKRQKKTDSRVAELEKKIDALTASLNAQGKDESLHGDSVGTSPATHPSPSSSSYPPLPSGGIAMPPPKNFTYPHRPMSPSSSGMPPFPTDSGQKRRRHTEPLDQDKDEVGPPRKRPEVGRNGTLEEDVHSRRANLVEDIDNILDSTTGDRIFERYCEILAPQLPAVVFPYGTKAVDVKKQSPVLYLAILVAASVGAAPIDVQLPLNNLLTATLADWIIKNGDKSLELLQALLITCIWYRPPRRFEQMNFYQLGHISMTMALDLGMGKRMKPKKAKREPTNNNARVPCLRTFVDPSTPQARRAWLGCYFLCTNTSMTLRRPNLLRWSSYMDECIEVLQTSPEAVASDKFLCEIAKLQRVSEQVGIRFMMDDPSATISLADQSVQQDLEMLEERLKEWEEGVPKDVWNNILRFHHNNIRTYMHEIALHSNHNVDDFRAPFTEESLRAVYGETNGSSPVHQAAVAECKAAVHATFGAFLNYSHHTLGAAPIFYFVRIAYTVVVCLKLYFSASTPGSFVGKVISADELQVENYLDKLLRLLHTVAEDESVRPANKFLLILNRMRGWFVKGLENQRTARSSSANGGAARNAQSGDQKFSNQSSYGGNNPAFQQQAKTPLLFLSEVATNANAQPSPGYASQQLGNASSPATSNSSAPHHAQTYPSSRTPNLGQTQPHASWYNVGGAHHLENGGGYHDNGTSQPQQMSADDYSNTYNMGVGFDQAGADWALGGGGGMNMDLDLNSFFMMNDPGFFGNFDFADMGLVGTGDGQGLEVGSQM